MTDRQRLNTPLIYNVFRWGLLGAAVIIGISAFVVCLTVFFGKGWQVVYGGQATPWHVKYPH